MKKIAIFASGTGSNATKIVEYFSNHSNIKIALIISNKAKAKVLVMAKSKGIPTLIITRTSFYETENWIIEEKEGTKLEYQGEEKLLLEKIVK